MADIKISELTQAESLSTSDLLESAVPYNGGFLSRRMSLAQLSNYLENYVQHQALTTTAKTIVSAINEILGDLANYYTISQTYSKTEVDTLIAGVSGLHFLVVSQLPTTDIDVNTIYLVPKQDVGTQDIYDEFIYIVEEAPTPSHWEKIGTTEIDLSDYVTDTELTTILNDYVTSSGLSTILANYATTSAMTTALADKVDKVSGKGLSTEDYTTAEKTKVNGLATVATSGSYNDLTDKPTIPTNTDEKVKQTAVSSSSNENYRLLLSKSASNTEETDGVQKSGSLYYNPYDNKVTVQNVDISNTANIATAKVTSLITSQYYFNLGSGSAVAMLEANSASTASNPTFVTLPASSGTLALQSESVLWSHNNLLGAKNLIPINTTEKSHTQNNVQFTLNEDGSIKAHITGTGSGGTFDVTTKADENLILPNGTYIFSGCPSGGSNTKYRCRVKVYNITTGTESSYGFDTGSGVTVTVNETEGKGIIEIACLIYSGYNGSDLLFKPMIRPSSIADDTYTPPSQTNRQLTTDKMAWSKYAEYGVKNLIPFPWSDASGKSGRGITFEYDNEGYVTLNGTASTTSAPYFRLSDSSANAVANGSYLKIKGNKKYRFKNEKTDDRIYGIMYLRNIDGTAPSNINIFIRFDDGTEVVRTDSINLSDSGVFHSSCEFVVQSSNEFYLEIDIRVPRSSGSYSPSTAKGRLIVTEEEVTDLSWMPYAMSNYELTMNKMDIINIAPTEDGNSASKAYAIGDYMIWKRRFYKVTSAISSGGAISGKVTATTLSAEIKAIRDALNI